MSWLSVMTRTSMSLAYHLLTSLFYCPSIDLRWTSKSYLYLSLVLDLCQYNNLDL